MKCEVHECQCEDGIEMHEIVGRMHAYLLSGDAAYHKYDRALVYLCPQHLVLFNGSPVMSLVTCTSPKALLLIFPGSIKVNAIQQG